MSNNQYPPPPYAPQGQPGFPQPSAPQAPYQPQQQYQQAPYQQPPMGPPPGYQPPPQAPYQQPPQPQGYQQPAPQGYPQQGYQQPPQGYAPQGYQQPPQSYPQAPAGMSDYDGIGDAELSGGGVWFLDGVYDVELVRVHEHRGRDGIKNFIIEANILASSQPERPVGLKCSQVIKQGGKGKDMFLGNVKGFLAAAFGLDVNKPADKARAATEITPVVVGRVVSDQNPLCGTKLRLTCSTTRKRDGGDFTLHRWSPMSAAGPMPQMQAARPPAPPAQMGAPPGMPQGQPQGQYMMQPPAPQGPPQPHPGGQPPYMPPPQPPQPGQAQYGGPPPWQQPR